MPKEDWRSSRGAGGRGDRGGQRAPAGLSPYTGEGLPPQYYGGHDPPPFLAHQMMNGMTAHPCYSSPMMAPTGVPNPQAMRTAQESRQHRSRPPKARSNPKTIATADEDARQGGGRGGGGGGGGKADGSRKGSRRSAPPASSSFAQPQQTPFWHPEMGWNPYAFNGWGYPNYPQTMPPQGGYYAMGASGHDSSRATRGARGENNADTTAGGNPSPRGATEEGDEHIRRRGSIAIERDEQTTTTTTTTTQLEGKSEEKEEEKEDDREGKKEGGKNKKGDKGDDNDTDSREEAMLRFEDGTSKIYKVRKEPLNGFKKYMTEDGEEVWVHLEDKKLSWSDPELEY